MLIERQARGGHVVEHDGCVIVQSRQRAHSFGRADLYGHLGTLQCGLNARPLVFALLDDEHPWFWLDDDVAETDVIGRVGVAVRGDAHGNGVKAFVHDRRREGHPVLARRELDVLLGCNAAIDGHLEVGLASVGCID